MNTTKSGSYSKLIAFFLVAVILLCAFGFAVEGWQPDPTEKPNSGDAESNGDADKNKDENQNTTPEDDPKPEKPVIPEYTNSITGLEITAEQSGSKHLCFVYDSAAPLYGISSSDLLIEIPTEGDTTRFLSFVSDAKGLGKIGSIAPTRGYISNLAKNFSSILISHGNDDSVDYESLTLTSHLDLTKYTGYHYTEYSLFNYTNGDLISAGLTNSNIGAPASKLSLPYRFNDFGAAPVLGQQSAKSVIIPFSDNCETEFYYSAADKSYTMSKNGSVKKDMLNDSTVKFNNIIVLFADTITYESENSSEMIMNTIGSGKGVYISEGMAQNITWTADPLGNITFYNELSEQLTINRGTSYIAFAKSSKIEELSVS